MIVLYAECSFLQGQWLAYYGFSVALHIYVYICSLVSAKECLSLYIHICRPYMYILIFETVYMGHIYIC